MNDDRSHELIARYLDDLASPEEVRELDTLLLASAAAADELARLSQLATMLELQLGGIEAQFPLPPPALPAAPATRPAGGIAAMLSAALEAIPGSPLVHSLLFIFGFYGSVVLCVWGIAFERRRVDDAAPQAAAGAPIARLTSVDHCEAPGQAAGELAVGRALAAGDAIELVSGVAEVTFAQGARVLIEGPARCSLHSAAAGFLHFGRLTARVPGPARGFCIDTPTMRVVDLGTEFGVDAGDKNNAAEVQVFTGTVLVAVAGETPGAQADRRRLVAGQGIRVGRAGVAAIAPQDSKIAFVRNFSAPANFGARQRIDLAHATASQSSQYQQQTADLAIDGNLQTHSHTQETDDHPLWQLDLAQEHPISAIVLHNRSDSFTGRFRDLTVTILAADGQQVLWKAEGVNKDNVFGGGRDDLLRGPDQVTLDVLQRNGCPVRGRFIRVERTPMPHPEVHMRNVLFIAECEVYESPDK